MMWYESDIVCSHGDYFVDVRPTSDMKNMLQTEKKVCSHERHRLRFICTIVGINTTTMNSPTRHRGTLMRALMCEKIFSKLLVYILRLGFTSTPTLSARHLHTRNFRFMQHLLFASRPPPAIRDDDDDTTTILMFPNWIPMKSENQIVACQLKFVILTMSPERSTLIPERRLRHSFN